jgi:hypothetical protein
MDELIPKNNEFAAAEKALRKLGSNLWFGGLTEEWKEYLCAHAVEVFDMFEMPISEAAQIVLNALTETSKLEPAIMQTPPSESSSFKSIINCIYSQ